MTAARKAVAWGLALCGIAAGTVALSAGSGYTLRVLSIAGIYAILALGYQFIFGHAGALALSQGTFMGLAAYVSGVLNIRYGLAFDAALPFSVGAAMVLALLVAIPVLRLQTHYFALATLMIGQIVSLIAIQWESVTGGANGIGGVAGLSLGGAAVRAGAPALLMIWTLVACGALVAGWAIRGRRGAAYAVMRANPAAARAIGIDTARLRLEAFLLSAAFAGVAGSLYAHVVRVISPDVLGFPVMVTCLTIAVVGGRVRIGGAIAGAVLIIALPEWFRFLRDSYLLAYGVMLLLVVVAMPDGLVVAAERIVARVVRDPVRSAPAAASLPPVPPASCMADLLVIAHVSRRFGGILALDDVSLSVCAGEVVGLIGANGSGKTTLLNAVSGIFPAQSGRVVFAGADITARLPHAIARAGIGRTFQTAALVDDLSAMENVAVACVSCGAVADAEAMTLLAMVGAADAAFVPCGALPYGIRRRVEIARALALRPRLLLLDEPAAGLNETEQADLAARLRGIAAAGTALLVIEHNMPFLAGLAERLVCLDHGRVVAQGSPADVRNDPRVIEAWLGGGALPP